MMRRRKICRHATLAAVLASIACTDGLAGINDDFFTADATVQGRVLDLSDKPLSDMGVALSAPAGTSTVGYQPAFTTTDAAGNFRVMLFRVGPLATPRDPDTITARVIVTAIASRYKELPGGGFPVDSSVAALLHFVPHNTKALVASATVRWNVP